MPSAPKIRLESTVNGATSFEWRNVPVSTFDQYFQGLDLYMDALSRTVLTNASSGELGINSTAAATVSRQGTGMTHRLMRMGTNLP